MNYKKTTISLIVAVAENNVIGNNNQLIWHLPADLRYFKEKTLNKPVIMGRKTFESIVAAIGKPLPQRKNIVITRDPDFSYESDSVLCAHSLPEAIKFAENLNPENNTKNPTNASGTTEFEIMILGGSSIYEQALALGLIDRIYLTRVHHAFEGDAFFPVLNADLWRLDSEEKHYKDEKNAYDYTFQVYVMAKKSAV